MARSVLIADDPVVDLAVVEAMVNNLEEYILREDLYQTVIASTQRGELSLQMTGGDLLTRLYRLHHLRGDLMPEQAAQLDAFQATADATIKSLRSRFHDRLKVELKSRLNSISWFLDETSGDEQRRRVEYPFEIRNRQRIEEILKLVSAHLDETLLDRLSSIDSQIRLATKASNFVWDAKLKPAFPHSPYWYLYVSP